MIKLRYVALWMFALSTVLSWARAQDQVLLVHSYHAGYPWTDSVTKGVREALENADADLEIFYMDTKRRTSKEWKAEAGKRAVEKMREIQPKVVIASDDNAQTWFVQQFAGKKDAPQFVFCGVNERPEAYGYPAPNVTGILQRPHFVETIKLMQRIYPKTAKIAIISDNSPTSDAMVEFCRKQKIPVKIVSCEQPDTLSQWKDAVKRCEKTVDAILIGWYHTLHEGDAAQSIDPALVINWTIAHTKKPTMGLSPFTVEDGALCGIAMSGEEHGFDAGLIATQILGGKKAGDFPLSTARRGKVLLNVKTAEKLNARIPFELIRAADEIFE